MSETNRYPKGWDEPRVQRLIDHYEQQAEEERDAEDEAAFEDESHAFIED